MHGLHSIRVCGQYVVVEQSILCCQCVIEIVFESLKNCLALPIIIEFSVLVINHGLYFLLKCAVVQLKQLSGFRVVGSLIDLEVESIIVFSINLNHLGFLPVGKKPMCGEMCSHSRRNLLSRIVSQSKQSIHLVRSCFLKAAQSSCL